MTLLALLLVVAAGTDAEAPALTNTPRQVTSNTLPVEFLLNRGQWDPQTRLRGRIGSQTVSFDRDGVRVHAYRVEQDGSAERREGLVFGLLFDGPPRDLTDPGAGGDQAPVIEGVGRTRGARNLFIGADPSRWQRDVPAFREVVYRRVSDGVDVRFHVQDGRLKYDVLLQPAADLDGVVLRCEGVDELALDADGALQLHVADTIVAQPAPVTYAVSADGTPRPLTCRFRILGDHRFGFELPDWDGREAVVIDPGLKVGTYLGSSLGDLVFALQVAANGDVVLAGETDGFTFPTTPGAYRSTHSLKEGFIARFDPTGSTLLHSTFFGGSGRDSIFDLHLDAMDVATFCGWTGSTDLPTTPGAFQRTFQGGGVDAFVGRMTVAEGATPSMLTYFGSDGDEMGLQVLADPGQGVYVGGITDSSSWPVIIGGYDPTHNGGIDVFLSLLSLDGKSRKAFTFLGGSGNDGYLSAYYIPLRLARSGNGLYVASQTYSDDFPTTIGVVQDLYDAGGDAFVSMLTKDLDALTLSTYLGGSAGEVLSALEVTTTGDVLVGGYTGSSDYPVTANAFDQTYNGPPVFFVDSYVSMMTADFTSLTYSTFLGGWNHDLIRDLALEESGTIVAVGTSDSQDFPITANAYDTTKNGPNQGIAGQDGFLTRLDPTAGPAGLRYSTWLGGSSLDIIKFVGLDTVEGSYYLAGDTASKDFPTTGGYDSTFDGSLDVFFARLCLASWSNYGQGLAGTGGVPAFTLNNPPVQGTTVTFSLDNSAGVPTWGLAFVGTSANPNSGGNPGELHVDPVIWILVPLGVGVNQFPWWVPTGAAYCGLPVHLQVLEQDAGATGGKSFTAALQMVIGG